MHNSENIFKYSRKYLGSFVGEISITTGGHFGERHQFERSMFSPVLNIGARRLALLLHNISASVLEIENHTPYIFR